MLNRVTDLAASRVLMGHVTDTRRAVDDLQEQLASGQKSQTYAGIADASERLVGLEATRAVYERFTAGNDRMDRQLTAVDEVLGTTRELVNDVRFALIEFGKTERTDPVDVRLMQEKAFKALQTLESVLNTEHEGQFLLSGTRVRTQPVDLDLSTLDAFQQRYDGNAVTYPTTRDAHLIEAELSHADTGDLTFDRATGTITAANAGSLARLPVGATVTVGGTTANDDRFTITANTGTVLTVRSEKLAATEAAPAATLTGPDGAALDAAATGGLAIDAAAGTITAATSGALAGLEPGTVVTLGGAPTAANDGDYTVLANDGTTLKIAQHALADETPAPATSSLTIAPYYRGDTVASTHRADRRHDLTVDLTAVDPPFEKIIRALGHLAQGEVGTKGGLDRHPERVQEALYLINSALERSVSGTPPFGPEADGNLVETETNIGLQRVVLADTNERLASRIAFLEGEIGEIETADKTETSLRLFEGMNALEASLTTIARIRQLSMTKFI